MMPSMGGLRAWAMGRSTSRTPRGSQVRAHAWCQGMARAQQPVLAPQVSEPTVVCVFIACAQSDTAWPHAVHWLACNQICMDRHAAGVPESNFNNRAFSMLVAAPSRSVVVYERVPE